MHVKHAKVLLEEILNKEQDKLDASLEKALRSVLKELENMGQNEIKKRNGMEVAVKILWLLGEVLNKLPQIIEVINKLSA